MDLKICDLFELLRPWLPLILTFLLCRWIYYAVFWTAEYLRIRSVIKRKQTEREQSFRNLENQDRYKLSAKHDKILSLSDDDLIEGLQSRKLSATEVLEAFVAKALKVTRELNPITEFIPQAEEWARELDALKTVKGPLHGLPVSVKEQCFVKGTDSSMGVGKYLYKPMADDSVIVKVFKDLGAVPFCKTNVPQTLLSYGCQNPIFGTTLNNINPKLSSGGSSGGESSLIGGGGSRVGIGSDIGGSVRIPAHFCGIVGFKGTSLRISGEGFRKSLPNVIGLYGVPGLMAQNAKTIAKVAKVYLEDSKQSKYDPIALPIPWNETMFSSKRKLKIGYFTSLPYFPLIGDTEEVTLRAKSVLESLGHELVPFKMPDSHRIMDMVFDFAFADKGMHLLQNWRCEPIAPALFGNYLICKAPFWLRNIWVWLMTNPRFKDSLYTPVRATIVRAGVERSGLLWDKMGDRKELVDEICREWRSQGIDLLLTPVYPFPACGHEDPGKIQPAVLYTMVWNLADFPAGSIPFGMESGKKVDKFDPQGDVVLKLAKETARRATNMPISVQLVGLPYQEELVLRAMVELEAARPKT